MECPKCGAVQPEGTAICIRCGLVFEKYWKHHPRFGAGPPPSGTLPAVGARRPRAARQDARQPGWAALLLPRPAAPDPLAGWLQAALLAGLTLWGVRLSAASVDSNAAGESMLHLVNLPFHEAGHLLFRPFGAFMTSLGGTLGQLLMPLICFFVLLLKTRDPFGAAVALWWFGQNFLDIAPYINDARAGVLPLLGGNVGHRAPYGFHDWEYLLTETGLLNLDQTLARFCHLLGSLIMLLALVWGGLLVLRRIRGV